MTRYYLGVDGGGTNCRVRLADADLKTLAEAKLRRRRGVLTAAVSVGVVLALTCASFALGASMQRDRGAHTTPAVQHSATTSATPTPTSGAATPPAGSGASGGQQGRDHSAGTHSGAPAGPGVSTQRGNPSSYLRGRVVDASGVGVDTGRSGSRTGGDCRHRASAGIERQVHFGDSQDLLRLAVLEQLEVVFR